MGESRRFRTIKRWAGASIAAAVASAATRFAEATIYTWTGGQDKSWNTPENWTSATETGFPGSSTTVDTAIIGKSQNGVIFDGPAANLQVMTITSNVARVDTSALSVASYVTLDDAQLQVLSPAGYSGSNGIATMTIGSTSSDGFLHVGWTSSTSRTALVQLGQSGGTESLTTYGQEFIGENAGGSFSQYGGTHTIGGSTGDLFIGSGRISGSYALLGGSLAASRYEYIGDPATWWPNVGSAFSQSGGSNRALVIVIADGSTYNLSGGSVTCTSQLNIGAASGAGGAYFNQTGGSVSASTLQVRSLQPTL